MITIRDVARLSTYIHMRITASEQQPWKEAAALRGQTLSELVRKAIEAELVTPVITARAGALPSVSPETQPARAKTLEERLADINAIVDGLGSQPVPGFPNRRSSARMQVKPGVSTPSFYRDVPRRRV